MMKKTGYALLEYIFLAILFMTVLVVFRSYVQRGMQGQYRKAGDSFGMLRQYNPGASVDCAYNDQNDQWYSQECFNNKILVSGCKVSANYAGCVNAVRTACVLPVCSP